MLDPPLVFIDVDTQRDFLEPGGALFIADSQAIRPNLARLTRFARLQAIPIIATACDHSPDDEEFQIFPPHCLSGTSGHSRIGETAVESLVLAVDQLYAGQTPPHLTLSKSQYDVFHRTDAAEVFQTYSQKGRATFVVYGVATDYCVKKVVEGLLERGHRVAVVADAVRSVEPLNEPDVLTEFVRRGAILTSTEAVCS